MEKPFKENVRMGGWKEGQGSESGTLPGRRGDAAVCWLAGPGENGRVPLPGPGGRRVQGQPRAAHGPWFWLMSSSSAGSGGALWILSVQPPPPPPTDTFFLSFTNETVRQSFCEGSPCTEALVASAAPAPRLLTWARTCPAHAVTSSWGPGCGFLHPQPQSVLN